MHACTHVHAQQQVQVQQGHGARTVRDPRSEVHCVFRLLATAVPAVYGNASFLLKKWAADLLLRAPLLRSRACLPAAPRRPAQVVHDYGHVGLTNDFLAATSNPLALRYNDHSPLENHHCAAAFKALQLPELNFTKRLPRDKVHALRKQVRVESPRMQRASVATRYLGMRPARCRSNDADYRYPSSRLGVCHLPGADHGVWALPLEWMGYAKAFGGHSAL